MSAPRGKNLFDESGVISGNVVSLSVGAPGGEHLQSAARTVSEATAQLMVNYFYSLFHFTFFTSNFTRCKTLVLIASFSNIVCRCEFVSWVTEYPLSIT